MSEPMTRITDEVAGTALAAYLAHNAAGAEREEAMRVALEAALPYLPLRVGGVQDPRVLRRTHAACGDHPPTRACFSCYGVSDEAVEAACVAMRGHDCHEVVNANIPHLARVALEAALPFLACSCPHISEVDDHCPQHGRDT